MSIKINASYTKKEEKEILERMFKPLVRAGAKVKETMGERHGHIYITRKKEGEKP